MRSVLAAATVLVSIAGCSASEPEPSGVDVELEGIRLACIDPCAQTYEVRLPSTVTNGTHRSSAEITVLVLDAMRAELATHPEIDVDEGRDATTTSGALRLAAAVPTLVYSGGSLSATVRLYVYRYWTGALVGTITKTATMSGVTRVDSTKEDVVIAAATTQATKTFVAGLPGYL